MTPARGGWLYAAGLLAVVVALFAQTVGYDFASYDESGQVIENPLVRSLGPRNLTRIFTRYSVTNYYPVRLLSFALDYRLWRLDARGYHLANVLAHAANVLLLYALGLRLTGLGGGPRRRLPAFLAALLFTVHPAVVEPAAWVGGREELLMVFFGLLAVLAYIRAGACGGRRRLLGYGLSALACAGACLCNIVGVVIPGLLVALELCGVRPEGPAGFRAQLVAVLRRTGAHWAIAIAAVIVKKIGDAATTAPGAVIAEMNLGLGARVLTVLHTYAMNVRTLVWPTELILIYPKTVPQSVMAPGVIAGVLLAGLSLWLLWRSRHRPLVLFGLLWFAIGLAPSAQIVPHHIYRADRFLYLPLAGLGMALAFLVPTPARRRWPTAVYGLAALLLAARAFGQVRVWRNAETVFVHCLNAYPGCIDAHNNLGIYLFRQGRVHDAWPHFVKALELDADNAEANYNMGVALDQQARFEDAARHYRRTLAIRPDYVEAHNNLGNILRRTDRLEEALAHYSAAIRANPEFAEAYNNAGLVLAIQGREGAAIGHFQEALRLNPELGKAHNNLGIALDRKGRLLEALQHYSRAVELGPNDVEALYNLGNALVRSGQRDAAAAPLSRVLQLQPGHQEARRLLEL
ncbi:MAG: tetratricopeptide repeat protein [Kiritimatiellae bacterium]|nr:tetratricopeptide repeat protein [Kiritimatiellia bacterium]